MSVIVVDDDDVYGELLQQQLEANGIEARFQHGPFGTVNLIRRLCPALVITDVNMPAISGDSLVKLVRESPSLNATKLMFISSMPPHELVALGRRVGADASISKSAPLSEIIALVRRLIADDVA